MKRFTIILLVVLIAGASYWIFLRKEAEAVEYQYGSIELGSVTSTISCTGTLNALETVEVGTQVSGTISHINVDYNDPVSEGQLLAVLDTSLLSVAVSDARASLNESHAQLHQANQEFERVSGLFEADLVSETEYETAETAYRVAQASVLSREAGLQRAEINLEYASIHSPITGVVIDRAVEEGQTVAASMSAPTLFVIARDLSSMELLAQVDESDIGEIQQGQRVEFTVPAYPDLTFDGTVRQIRLQPETLQNVVTYTVVIDAENPDSKLLPGMTATVDFIIEEANDVFLVPSAALTFHPTQNMMEEMFANRPGPPPGFQPGGENSNPLPRERMEEAPDGSRPSPPENFAMLWRFNTDGMLVGIPVLKGLSDGRVTQISSSQELTSGMEIILGSLTASTTQQESTQRRMMGGPPPGGRPPMF